MYERILVPTDGSETSRRALEEALALASESGGEIHALYVVDTSTAGWAGLGDEEFGVEVGRIVDILEADGEEAVAEAAAAGEAAGVTVVTAIEQGTPYRAILTYVDESDVDLLVMGTHGRRGLDRFILGSTTERVIRRSDIPVLTIRLPEGHAA